MSEPQNTFAREGSRAIRRPDQAGRRGDDSTSALQLLVPATADSLVGCGVARSSGSTGRARLPGPLALPWPAWHTKPADGDTYSWLFSLSDKQLVEIEDQQDSFKLAHSYRGYRRWISHEEFMAAFDVSGAIRRIMASRFRDIVKKRETQANVRRFVRRARKTDRRAA